MCCCLAETGPAQAACTQWIIPQSLRLLSGSGSHVPGVSVVSVGCLNRCFLPSCCHPLESSSLVPLTSMPVVSRATVLRVDAWGHERRPARFGASLQRHHNCVPGKPCFLRCFAWYSWVIREFNLVCVLQLQFGSATVGGTERFQCQSFSVNDCYSDCSDFDRIQLVCSSFSCVVRWLSDRPSERNGGRRALRAAARHRQVCRTHPIRLRRLAVKADLAFVVSGRTCVGRLLTLSLRVCAPGFYGCYNIPDVSQVTRNQVLVLAALLMPCSLRFRRIQTISYPTPTISPGTLRLTKTPELTTRCELPAMLN